MKHLRERTAEVELSMPAPPAPGDLAAVAQLAKSRRVAINRGDRLARAFRLDGGPRVGAPGGATTPELAALVTDAESRALLEAGAKWVGAAADAPRTQPYIDQLRVRGFRCIVDVTIPLTPLHAFIGPNDSGKSTLLAALAEFVGVQEPGAEIIASYKQHAMTDYLLPGGQHGRIFHEVGLALDEALANRRRPNDDVARTLAAITHPVRILRLDPDAMREPNYLIPQASPIAYDDRGRGLAGVYDALLSRQLDAFLAISKELTALFPTVRAIQLINVSRDTKALSVELMNGKTVAAPQLSEGMLYLAALPRSDRAAPHRGARERPAPLADRRGDAGPAGRLQPDAGPHRHPQPAGRQRAAGR
jgi:energy-coupling factor transporter ATP-binding protein EcfA2